MISILQSKWKMKKWCFQILQFVILGCLTEIKLKVGSNLILMRYLFRNVNKLVVLIELGLSDELLAYLYWPVSGENGLRLNEQMLENYPIYEEQLTKYDFTSKVLFDLAIK